MKVLKVKILLIFFLFSCNEKEVIDVYENGQIKVACSLDENGRRNGQCVHYYQNGKKKSINEYVNDTLNGRSDYFHKNGTLWWSSNYHKGLKNGNVKYYDSLGNIFQSLFFRNGKPHGKNYTFYTNGKIKDELVYDEGIPTGVHTTYYPSGSIGREVTLNENGELIDKIKFDSLGAVKNRFIKIKFLTLNKGNTYDLEILNLEPVGNEFLIVLGNLDSNDILVDTLAIKTSKSNESVNLNLMKSILPENNIVTGKVYDLSRINDSSVVVKNYRKLKLDLKNNKELYFSFY